MTLNTLKKTVRKEMINLKQAYFKLRPKILRYDKSFYNTLALLC